MTSHYRHRRTSTPATAFPSPVEPGEIVVNSANRQLVVGDADATQLGTPLLLLAVRYFDPRAQYATGDLVVQAGALYRAKAAINPGAFNAASWDLFSSDATIKAYADAGDAAVTTAFQAADTALQTNINAKTDKAYVDAADALKADKTYVDNADALKAPLASPIFTGDPKAPTPAVNDNDTSVATTAFVTAAVAASGAAGAVRYDAPQSLTTAQLTQARQNIYAAPFDAMAYNGLQINGSCEIDQTLLGNVNALGSNEFYFADMWTVASGGAAGVLSSSQTTVPPPGYAQYPRIFNITALPTLAAGDYAFMRTRIEGYRCLRVGFGSPTPISITVGFWIQSGGVVPSTVTLFVQNAAANRTYLANISVGSGAWEYKTVTIPGDPAGTWNVGNGVGMSIGFCIGAGATFQGANATWNAKNCYGTAQTTNLLATTGNQVCICGLTVHAGNEAPSAARSPFIMRAFDNELILCQRYFQKSWDYGTAPGTPWAGGSDQFVFSHPTAQFATTVQFIPKRAIPTLTTYDGGGNPGVVSAYTSGWTNGAAIAVMGVKDKQFFIQVNIATSIYTNFGFKLDARL